MPSAPPRPCTYPGCAGLSHQSRCELHRTERNKHYDRYRRDKEAKRFYNSDLWQKARVAKLSRDPLCAKHLERGQVVAAELVHHLDGDIYNLLPNNLQSLCNSCHTSIEVAQRGDKTVKTAWGG